MNKPRTIIGTLAVIALLGSGALLFARAQENAAPAKAPAVEAPPAAQAPPAPGVTFVTVTPHDLPEQYERLGVVEPSRTADVRARVEGFLAERLFEEGEHVEAGQVLYRIERDTYEATERIRKAELEDARARLDLARREYDRAVNLGRTGAIAQERLDQTEIERERANAAVERAEASLQEARLDLGYTEVVAPISGVVGKAVHDQGDLVDDSSNSLLTTITCISPIYVSYGISEVDYLQLRKGGEFKFSDNVRFTVMLKNGETFDEPGKLNYQAAEFEPSTGMLRVRIEYPNAQRVLRPNQFVKIIEDHGLQTEVLTVPKQSVIQSPAGAAVFVIDENDTLQFRPVKVGPWRNDQWVIASGLQPGERVMVEGLLKSRPGAPVNPSPYVSSAVSTD